jgi:peroxiredoxin
MNPDTSLTRQLADYKAQSLIKIPAERLAVMANATQALRDNDNVSRALKVGAHCPDISLLDANGKSVALKSLWQQATTVIVFYRGAWCPYCNLELRAWQAMLPEMNSRGLQLCAVSPQTPDNSLNAIQKNQLAYPVLSDSTLLATKAFGLEFTFSQSLVDVYRGFEIDLPKANGNSEWTLPIPATYAINRQGEIVFASLDVDYRNRAEPSAVLAALTNA